MIKRSTPVKEVKVKGSLNNINIILSLFISIFITIIPYYRGLYFRENYIVSFIFISSVLLIILIPKIITKIEIHAIGLMDVFMFALAVTYVVSFSNSVNPQEGFDSVLKYMSYFMLYFIIRELTTSNDKCKNIIKLGIAISILLVGFTGILNMAGVLEYKGAVADNRLYGAFQYANTTGAVLASGIVYFLGLVYNVRKSKLYMFYNLCIAIIFTAFILTLSWGAFLVFCIALLIGFIVSDIHMKFYIIESLTITLVSSLSMIVRFVNGNIAEGFYLYFSIAIILALVLSYVFYKINIKYLEQAEKKTLNKIFIIIIVLLILACVVLYFASDTLSAYVSNLWNKDLKARNASDRLIFTKDAIKIFKDYPLFGTGGGGWKSLYKQYQSFAYNSAEAHNYFVQLAVESGIFGLAFTLAIIIILMWNFINEVLIRREYNSLHIYMAIAVLLGHSAIDFDLSLVAPMLILTALIGILDAESPLTIKNNSFYKYIVSAVALFVLFFSLSINSGIEVGHVAASISNSDIIKSMQLYEKAMKRDKYNAAYRIDYAQIECVNFLNSQDIKHKNSMMINIDEAFKLDSYNFQYANVIINMFLNTGEIDRALEVADDIVKKQPLNTDAYLLKMEANYNISEYYFNIKEHKKAIPYLENIIETAEQFNIAEQKSIKPIEKPERMKNLISEAQKLIEQASQM